MNDTTHIITMKCVLLCVALGIIVNSGCTYSINMVHIEGKASDVVDDSDTNAPQTSVTIPLL